MSGTRSEDCWASARHLPIVCTMRDICESVIVDRDGLRVERDGLRMEVSRLRAKSNSDDVTIAELHAMNLALSERVAGQAEILSQRAERTTADDLRDGEGEG